RAVSRLAAELFFGRPAAGAWHELEWTDYPAEVTDRHWRALAATLRNALDGTEHSSGPILTRLLTMLAEGRSKALATALTNQPENAVRSGCPGPAEDNGRELLITHVTATVHCAAVDAGVATPALDWLDGPVLLMNNVRRTDLTDAVARAVDHSDDTLLRGWLAGAGVRSEIPVRLP
ncbi:hypothetical protein ACFV04_14180, partial [Kitasatospora sp. NPDC059599]